MASDSANNFRPLSHLREEMAGSAEMAYFDHAALSPLPRGTAQRIRDFADQSAQVGNTHWLSWLREAEQTRSAAAAMIGADGDEIALMPNTTLGVNLVSQGLDWREGDNVVTLADEFPTNLYPWMHLATRGVETRLVETDNGVLDYDELAQACDARTRIVSVSWVGYQTGYRLDLERVAEVCHQAGSLLFVDAIQGLGVFPLDVRQVPIDFLATGGQKWLLGPEGVGFAYIRRRHLDQLQPFAVGWNSVAKPFDYTHIELNFKPSAARFEAGGWNMCGLMALGRSLALLNSIGTAALAAQVLDYTDLACQRLAQAGAVITTNRDGEHRSGIVCFELPGRDPQEVRHRCLERNIVLSCRSGRLRISPHAYNTEEDLDRLLEVISA